MKFETERIYLVKWRFWFVVWSTMATWRKDFSSLLAKKKQQQQPCISKAHFFVHFFDVVLHDYNVKLYVGKFRMCSPRPMFCRVPVHFFFLHCRSFSPFGRLFSFSHRHFHAFPPTKFVSCFLSNALALLLMSLKTLKFSRTWLSCWFFSLLSPDALSLSKKSGWT